MKLKTSLTRYPLDFAREIRLTDSEARISIEETITDHGETAVNYSWLQHITLGEPFVSPSASLSVPCEMVIVDSDHDPPEAHLPPGESFKWPIYESDNHTIDLRSFPPEEKRIHDLPISYYLNHG